MLYYSIVVHDNGRWSIIIYQRVVLKYVNETLPTINYNNYENTFVILLVKKNCVGARLPEIGNSIISASHRL